MSVLLLTIHVLAAVIWVGGMFFAHLFLRPAALLLTTEQRVDLWYATLSRFFPWIWGIVVLLPLTGYALTYTAFGSLAQAGRHVLIMQWLGWTMIALFAITFFAFYRNMARMVRKRLIPEAGLYLNRIRRVVSINLILGLCTIVIAATGRYW
ncbi:MAG: CopD family protein [Magnetococcus sp. DMHC-8]